VDDVGTWREERIDDLLAAVSGLGITMSRAAAGDLLDERVQFVENQMRVTPTTARTYLTQERRGRCPCVGGILPRLSPGPRTVPCRPR
jgi:hypothetical protein